MIKEIKKIFSLFFVIAISCWNASAVHEKYDGGYEFVSSKVNTRAKELPMSFYKEGKVVFFVKDTAYIAKVGNDLDLVDVKVADELSGLGIEGTFAYDAKKRTIYFAKTDGLGNSDLYEAKWEGKSYSNPKKLSIEGIDKIRKPIKGSSTVSGGWTYRYKGVSGFFNPTLAKNGNRIYFSANFPTVGYGGKDIWYIDRNKDKNVDADWTMPKNASDSTVILNSKMRDDYPWTVGDTLLYFASDRPGDKGGLDLYVSRLVTQTKQTKDSTGAVIDEKKVEIWDTPEALTYFNSSANDFNMIANNRTLLFISNRTGGAGSDDIYYPASYIADEEPEIEPDFTIEEPKGFHWVLFFFDFDKSTMKPEYMVQLDELVSAMKEFPGAKFEIAGHTDNRGKDKYNLKLSQQRSDYVRQLLIERGLPANKLTSIGRGMHEPMIENAQTEAEHEQNRRVDIKMIEE
jgi:outer membrane protein OmpA-like peptidoglycan-associated protein